MIDDETACSVQGVFGYMEKMPRSGDTETLQYINSRYLLVFVVQADDQLEQAES